MSKVEFQTQSIPISFSDHGGGLNSTASALKLLPDESSDLQNIDFDKFGSFLNRNGYTQLNTSAFNSGATWNGLHWYEQVDGTQFLMGTCGNKLAKMDDLDGTWDDITGSLTFTAGDSNFTSFRTFKNTVVGTNNVDVPFKWTGAGNGATLTVPSGLTKAKFIEIFQGFTILAHVTVSATDHKSRGYFSTINTIETWASADFVDISPDDGQDITGLHILGEELVIFKDRSIYKALFTGDRDIPFIVRKTRSEVGCAAGHSIQEVKNGLVFRAEDGLYYFDGNSSFKLSDVITATYNKHNDARIDDTTSIYQKVKNRYWSSTSVGSATKTDEIITWDAFNNAFSRYKGIAANVFALVYTGGQERVYFGDYAGFVYRADDGLNDTPSGTKTAIDAYFYTRWHLYEDLVHVKETEHVYLYYQFNTGTIDFKYAHDFENSDTFSISFSQDKGGALYGTAVWDTDKWSGTGGTVKRLTLASRGRAIRFKLQNNRVDETFQIDGIGAYPSLSTYV